MTQPSDPLPAPQEPVVFWWCTELYLTKDQDNFGIAGDFEVVKAEHYRALQQACEQLREYKRKFHEAMDIMAEWKNIDHANAVAQLLEVRQERDQLQQALQQVAQALDILARLGHAPLLGNSNGNLIAQEALAVLEKVGIKHDGS